MTIPPDTDSALGDATDPRIELGPYSENIRLWLRGEGEFPKYLYLVLVVEKPARAQIAMIDPYEGVREGGHTHFFHVPGVLFMMAEERRRSTS